MPPEFLAVRIKKDLCGDRLDLVLEGAFLVRGLPNIDEFDVENAVLRFGQILQDRLHLFAGDALVRSQIQKLRQFLRGFGFGGFVRFLFGVFAVCGQHE